MAITKRSVRPKTRMSDNVKDIADISMAELLSNDHPVKERDDGRRLQTRYVHSGCSRGSLIKTSATLDFTEYLSHRKGNEPLLKTVSASN